MSFGEHESGEYACYFVGSPVVQIWSLAFLKHMVLLLPVSIYLFLNVFDIWTRPCESWTVFNTDEYY